MPKTTTFRQAEGRVQIAPHLDRWMRGDRYGQIVASRKGVGNDPEEYMLRVEMDRSRDTILIRESNVTYV